MSISQRRPENPAGQKHWIVWPVRQTFINFITYFIYTQILALDNANQYINSYKIALFELLKHKKRFKELGN